MGDDNIYFVISRGVIMSLAGHVHRMTGEPLLSNIRRMSLTVARHDVSDVRSGLINAVRKKIQTG